MAYKISIPFHAFKLKLVTGGSYYIPLRDSSALRIGEELHMLAGRYAETYQRKLLDKGKFKSILDEQHSGEYLQAQVELDFPAAKNGISFPEFSLEFDYFYNETNKGFWATVPTLGVEAYAGSLEDLDATVSEAIHLEFARNFRLKLVQKIVAAIWTESMELHQQEIDLKFHTPAELELLSEQKQEQILPKVAELLIIGSQVTYGRAEELDHLTRAMKGKYNKNILLVGPSGVGKTALIWELVRQRKKRKIKGDVWETTGATLIKELTRETGWKDNMIYLCKEIAKRNDFLFVRNLVELFEVGQYEGSNVSMAEYMKEFISRGEVNLISECTEEELARIELRSPKYTSLFQIIRLAEPKDDMEDIILQKVADIAKSLHTKVDKEAIKETIRLNRRFTPYSGFPGKPIRFLESILINLKDKKRGRKASNQINGSDVIHYFCEETGMPRFMVDPDIPMDLKQIKTDFKGNIFGQDMAVDSVVDLLGAVKTALTRAGKPIASFLFVGPTGVGKTEMAKVLAQFMFGSRDRMIRFDMSEYSTPYNVMRLLGTNHDGILTSAVRREPFSVLLFDEIEKADASFYDLLLQILGEGRLTDNTGKLVNFCSTIIIMTSNIGATNLQNNRIKLNGGVDVNEITEYFMTAVQKHFRPELFNRIDQVIPFKPLSKEVVRYVVDREISLLKKREGIQFRSLELQITDKVYDRLSTLGYNHKYGARHLQRAIREHLIIPLSQQLNTYDYNDQLIVKISLKKKKIQIEIESDPLGLDLLLEDLEKVNHADYASELRRGMNAFQEGHFYVRLLSDLTILEREKKKKGKKFWTDVAKGEKYAFALQTKTDVEKLNTQIEAYEQDLAMATLGLISYNPKLTKKLDKWSKTYAEYKIDFYERSNPLDNNCYLSVYGKDLRRAIDFYVKMCEQKGFKITGETLWYNEEYYNKIVDQYPAPKPGDTEPPKVERVKRAEYIKKQWNNSPNDMKAPKKGGMLVGINLTIRGKAAYIYFSEEAGLHVWELSEKEKVKNFIRVTNEIIEDPEELNRTNYNKKKIPVKRIYGVDSLKDTAFMKSGTAAAVRRGDYAKPMIQILDKHFIEKIDAELL